eukprot:TRINITY_DN62958_c0_g1_i1.p2 TRINITY_DN62958_c0_g1~~TRINITY_DN62958_c0_g1_i1.p2  ORF type:complete len:232 (+),score=52.70 TRINITY_DN62958_c0_g1_i1:97-696(+)
MPTFSRSVAPWKINQLGNTPPALRLYHKQLYNTPEWETVASPHPYLRFTSPDEPHFQLKAGSQFNGLWPAWYHHETLRQTGTLPQYKEYAPKNPFWRDIYSEWLNRNVAEDSPDDIIAGEGARVIAAMERFVPTAEHLQHSITKVKNLDRRKLVRQEIRQERFEEYMAMRAWRNKRLGIDEYGIWNKKAVAYLKRIGEH